VSLRASKKERARRAIFFTAQISCGPTAFFGLLRASSLIKGDGGPQTLR
jgi:hypothetical protein